MFSNNLLTSRSLKDRCLTDAVFAHLCLTLSSLAGRSVPGAECLNLSTAVVTMRWWLLVVLLVEATGTHCPPECACVDHDIDCSSRSLTQIPTEGISPHATRCDLSHNNLTSVRRDAFRAFTHATHIDLSANQIANVSSEAFSHLASAISIDLSRNNISHLDFHHVRSDRLHALYLSHNPHLRLPEHGFKLRHLRVLDMRHCGLAHIPGHFFAHAQRLEVLELGRNHLSSLESHAFSSLKHLVFLDLSGNRLATLPSGLLKQLDVSVHVKLGDNPFVCECRTHREYTSYTAHRGHVPLHCTYLGAHTRFTDFYRDHCSATPPSAPQSLPSATPANHWGVVVAATLSAILVAAFVVTVAVRRRRNVRLREPSPQRFSILKGSEEV